jgi:hypothetical protein
VRQDVTRHEHRLAHARELTQESANLHDAGRIQSVDRFVQDQQGRIVKERDGDRGALLHAQRVRADAVPLPRSQVDELQDLVDSAARNAAQDVAEAAQVVASGEVLVRRRPLDRSARQLAAAPRPDGPRPPAEHLGHTWSRPDEAQQHPDAGGLAGSVGPKEPEHLALANIEVQPVHGNVSSIRLAQRMRRQHRCAPHVLKAGTASFASTGAGLTGRLPARLRLLE